MKKSGSLILGISLYLLLVSASIMGQQLSLVTVNYTGTGSANDNSHTGGINADGRYVTFTSGASNIVPNDNNAADDAFVRDMVAGTTTLVSATSTGVSGNGSSVGTVISPNGEFVAFTSTASNLVPNDNNNCQDVFVRNMLTGVTSLVSVNSAGTGSANYASSSPLISDDGRYVAFMSLASDIVPNDTNGYVSDVFVRDLWTGTTFLVSVNLNGASGNRDAIQFAMSANGRVVAFSSYASDLVPGDGNNTIDVYVRNLDAGTTTLVSSTRLRNSSGNGDSSMPSISTDGRFIAFLSKANNLTSNDTNLVEDAFVRDMVTGTTTLVSVNRDGVSYNSDVTAGVVWTGISANGRVALFTAYDGDIVAHDRNHKLDIFARDLMTGRTQNVSSKVPRDVATGGELPGFENPVISADGRFVAFAIDRAPSGTARKNIYVRDLMTGNIIWINNNSGYLGGGFPFISGDGRFIAFASAASDLLPNVGNASNVFLFRNPQTTVSEPLDGLMK